MQLIDEESADIDRFGLLLGATVASVVVLSLVDMREPIGDKGGELGTLAFSVIVGATVLLAFRAAGVVRRLRLVADVFVGLAVVVSASLVATDLLLPRDLELFAAAAPTPLWVVASAVAPVVVVLRLLRHRRVTRGSLLGAVSGLLLTAITFSFVYLTVSHHQATPLFGEEEPTTSSMYFSLVTLTTLGYGDLAPKTELGRLLASTEAVIGQIYLVTFVAFLVSLYATDRARS